jgi:hypothetical protein
MKLIKNTHAYRIKKMVHCTKPLRLQAKLPAALRQPCLGRLRCKSAGSTVKNR